MHTVKGTPNLDSSPKVLSGKVTPISEMASFSDDTPADIYTCTQSPPVTSDPAATQCLTSDGADPPSPAYVSEGVAVARLGVVHRDLGEVLERTCSGAPSTL